MQKNIVKYILNNKLETNQKLNSVKWVNAKNSMQEEKPKHDIRSKFKPQLRDLCLYNQDEELVV